MFRTSKTPFGSFTYTPSKLEEWLMSFAARGFGTGLSTLYPSRSTQGLFLCTTIGDVQRVQMIDVKTPVWYSWNPDNEYFYLHPMADESDMDTYVTKLFSEHNSGNPKSEIAHVLVDYKRIMFTQTKTVLEVMFGQEATLSNITEAISRTDLPFRPFNAFNLAYDSKAANDIKASFTLTLQNKDDALGFIFNVMDKYLFR